MKVFVTGYAGHLGPAVVKRLSESGADVIGYDVAQRQVDGVGDIRGGDITDYDRLKSAMAGCDEVLHMAAVAMPFYMREHEVFNVNVSGTFNVFKACAELGIRKVAVTSSINAVGYNFGVKTQGLSYLPIDGSHPCYTTDPYSYSKQAAEDVGRYFYRRHGISSVFMRLGNGFSADDARPLRARIEALLRLPEKERGLEVKRIEADMEERRRYAFAEAPPYRNGTEYVFDCFTKEQIVWSNYIHNCLTYLHIDDLADAAVCAINAQYEGSYPIYVTDYVNVLGIESAVLAKLLYPGAAINHSLLKGCDALADYREAERIIGFRAKRSFDGRHSEIYA